MTDYDTYYSGRINVGHYYDTHYSGQVNLQHYAPPPITDLYSVSNPANPTVIINGVTIQTNVGTQNGTGPQIAIDYGSTLGCDFFNFSINMSLGGGSFTIKAQTAKGTLGAILTLFGIDFLVTSQDEYSDNTGNGWITEGVWSNTLLMSKQMLLLGEAPSMVPNQAILPVPLQTAPSIQWSTVKSLAMSLASAAGITLTWAAIDVPLMDAFLESGMSTGDAIRSLAQRVGAVVIPTASATSWVVTTLDKGYGGWQGIPNCALWGQGGLRGGPQLNMTPEMITFPIKELNAGDAVTAINNGTDNPLFLGTNPPVQILENSSQIVSSSTPKWNVQVPRDFGTVAASNLRFRIVVPDGSGQLSAGYTIPQSASNQYNWATIIPTVTQNPDGTFWAEIDASLFGAGLQNGKFQAQVGYIRDTTLSQQAFNTAEAEGIARKRALAQADIERIRYFRINRYAGQFSWYGSLPMPGNITQVDFGSVSGVGIVEGFSFSYPGNTVSVSIGEYQEINTQTPQSVIDYFYATGIGAIP